VGGAVSYTQRGILDNPAATLMPNPATPDTDVVEQHVREHLRWIFFTKLLDGETEHEYRLVESSMDDGYKFVDIGDTPRASSSDGSSLSGRHTVPSRSARA
jgi:hypothetical protein